MKNLFSIFFIICWIYAGGNPASAVVCDLSTIDFDQNYGTPDPVLDVTYAKDMRGCNTPKLAQFTGPNATRYIYINYCYVPDGCKDGYIMQTDKIEDPENEYGIFSHHCNSSNPLVIPYCAKEEQQFTEYCTVEPIGNANECSHTVYAANCAPEDAKYTGIIRGDYGDVCVFECEQDVCWNTWLGVYPEGIIPQFFYVEGYDYDLEEALGAQFKSLGLQCKKVNLDTCKWTYKCPTGLYGTIIQSSPNDQTGLAEPEQIYCSLCPENSTTGGPGATKQSECKCKENYYGEITDEGGVCTACPEHSTSDFNSATIDACKCDEGYYKSNNRCIECPALPNGVAGDSDDLITTDGAGKESITDCFIRAGSDKSMNDKTGYFYFTEDCNYKISAD